MVGRGAAGKDESGPAVGGGGLGGGQGCGRGCFHPPIKRDEQNEYLAAVGRCGSRQGRRREHGCIRLLEGMTVVGGLGQPAVLFGRRQAVEKRDAACCRDLRVKEEIVDVVDERDAAGGAAVTDGGERFTPAAAEDNDDIGGVEMGHCRRVVEWEDCRSPAFRLEGLSRVFDAVDVANAAGGRLQKQGRPPWWCCGAI